jgi:hypothetical protein
VDVWAHWPSSRCGPRVEIGTKTVGNYGTNKKDMTKKTHIDIEDSKEPNEFFDFSTFFQHSHIYNMMIYSTLW